MLDDSELSKTMFSPVCTWCIHWKARDGHFCEAFPKAEKKPIPDAIWSGKNKHCTPVKGDHGIQFAPHPDGEAKMPADLKAAYEKAHPEQGE